MTDSTDTPEFVEMLMGAVTVRGFVHRPKAPGPDRLTADALVLTHGAGSNCQSALLVALGQAFQTAGMTVLRCDLPFRQARPHGPPPRGSAEKDQQGLRAAVEFMCTQTKGRIFLGGHSYGGRQASMLSATQSGLVQDLLLLSYPLHPPRRPEQLRTTHFQEMQTPALFVHGTRDTFGSIAEMKAALKLIPGRTELLTIADVGHDLIGSRNRRGIPQQIAQRFLSFTYRGIILSVPAKRKPAPRERD